jgi:hypothetical protein
LPPNHKALNLLQVYRFNHSGHKAPSIADTPAGRYAGSLFTSASKTQALQTVLEDLTHLNKVIQS